MFATNSDSVRASKRVPDDAGNVCRRAGRRVDHGRFPRCLACPSRPCGAHSASRLPTARSVRADRAFQPVAQRVAVANGARYGAVRSCSASGCGRIWRCTGSLGCGRKKRPVARTRSWEDAATAHARLIRRTFGRRSTPRPARSTPRWPYADSNPDSKAQGEQWGSMGITPRLPRCFSYASGSVGRAVGSLTDLKSAARKGLWVRPPPPAPSLATSVQQR